MADNLVYEDTINSELSTSEFVDRQWLYINDNNNGSYSSQIVMDTTPLANSGGWVNWSEGLLLMPLVLQIETSVASGDINPALTSGYDWVVALKNGYWNILHALNVEFNNGSVVQQTPYMNLWCSFKALTSWCEGDVKNWGAVCGFYPDSSISWGFNDVAAGTYSVGCGYGLFNNNTSPVVQITIVGDISATGTSNANIQVYNFETHTTLSSQDSRYIFNQGLVQRMKYINYDPLQTSTINSYNLNQNLLLSQTSSLNIFRTCVQYNTTNGFIARSVCIDAVIRLKDIADMFAKMPMTKGGTFRMYLNTNQVYFQVLQTGAVYDGNLANDTGDLVSQGLQTLVNPPIILGGGGTNPVMFSSCNIGQGSSTIAAPSTSTAGANNTIVNVGLSIVRTQFSQINNIVAAPITSCRLYAPVYTLSPLAEQRLLSLSPTKKVIYEDIFYYQFPNQAGQQNFNLLVSNGLPNLRKVLVQALVNKASNGVPITINGTTGTTTNTLLSPFCSTGGTPDPISINNFQVQISGKNLFINQFMYDWEEFVEQLVSSNQLNGSLTTSMASGLIGKMDYQNLYRYYYGNASRSIPSEDGVAKAVQILGLLNCPANINCDIVVFLSFERDFTIDLRSGARVQ
jgi:hypothetical protein